MKMQVVVALVMAMQASASHGGLRRGMRNLAAAPAAKEKKISCGAVAKYDNAKPKNFEDARKTKYVDGKTVDVTFDAGAKIDFKCKPGFSTDGAKDGEKTFGVECMPSGFYKPEKVCVKASKCGTLPKIKNAKTTGKAKGSKVQFSCQQGYSLDGEKVIAGGHGKNFYFELECIEFSGQYSKFKGECKPYSFMPTGEAIKLYNSVFEVLFEVDCANELKKTFGKGKDIPASLEAACGKNFDEQSGDCSAMVSDIKSTFDKQKKAREEAQKESKKDWMDAADEKLPGVDKEAKEFCEKLWKLVELPGKK